MKAEESETRKANQRIMLDFKALKQSSSETFTIENQAPPEAADKVESFASSSNGCFSFDFSEEEFFKTAEERELLGDDQSSRIIGNGLLKRKANFRDVSSEGDSHGNDASPVTPSLTQLYKPSKAISKDALTFQSAFQGIGRVTKNGQF